jgi:plastocyanin
MAGVAVLGLVAAGCAKTTPGAGGSSSPAGVSSSPAAGAPVALTGAVTNKGTKDLSSMGTSVHFSLKADNEGGSEFYFNPTFLKIAPGAKITVELENEGNKKHNFTITALHVDQDLAPGQKKTITFTLPSNGAVNFFCEYHRALGMQGAFFSTAGQSLVTSTSSSGSTTSTSGSSTGYGY